MSESKAGGMRSLHGLGVACGLAAGVWLGAAEAPTKLVNSGLSPYAISLCMVAGVFVANWTLPTVLKGTRYVFADLTKNTHLIFTAILAGMLWAVANTLTIFAIRDVGLSIAFPLWNTNALVGIFWGRVLFGELKDAGRKNIAKVLLGATAIVGAAILLAFSTIQNGGVLSGRAWHGVLAATGASLLWGTMYIPYRKAYISGMNPLSFVTVFTVGELGTVLALVLAFDGGVHAAVFHSAAARPMLFWIFLGGFAWVIGDLFQQYAAKYLGIGRGIPLSNTNQMWGLAWGVLVFGEMSHLSPGRKLLIVAGSLVMILGALAVSTAVATEGEQARTRKALLRECARYGLDFESVLLAYTGEEASRPELLREKRRGWWDFAIVAAAVGIFIALGSIARPPVLAMNIPWLVALCAVLVVAAVASGWGLWRVTRFS